VHHDKKQRHSDDFVTLPDASHKTGSRFGPAERRCDFKAKTTTSPECVVSKTRQVIEVMKKQKQGELGELLGVSTNLAIAGAHGMHEG